MNYDYHAIRCSGPDKCKDVAALESQLHEAQERVKDLEDKWQKFICGEAEHQEKVCIAECHDQQHGYCYDMQRCKRLETENAALRADNATVVKYAQNLCENMESAFIGDYPNEDKLEDMFELMRELKHVLQQSSTGTDLLQELEQLRAVREAATELRDVQSWSVGKWDASIGLRIMESATRLDNALAKYNLIKYNLIQTALAAAKGSD